MNYEPIIGLEVHVELATNSKMFCGCPADHFGKKPNTQTCPVCLGLPGALPVPNKKAVEWTILLGLALGCSINEESKFDRKNYFYPDLSKGYQISQYDQPLANNGSIVISSDPPAGGESRNPSRMRDLKQVEGSLDSARDDHTAKTIRIRRVHLEEDTGKLQHATVDGRRVSLVDFNRSGVALVEIVTEPDFRTVEEVDEYVKKLQQIVRYLGISGADMEKGSMRLEPSISLRPMSLRGAHPTKQSVKIATPAFVRNTKDWRDRDDEVENLPSYRVELKNINSFRFARKALEYEIERQTEMLDRGEQPKQQTRGWDEGKAVTVPQREKEEAQDYRYFPEPDIPPMKWEKSQISKLKSQIAELPDEKKKRFMRAYELNDYDAGLLIESRMRADYFETCIRVSKKQKVNEISPKTIANWIINRGIDLDEVVPAELVSRIIKSAQVVQMPDDALQSVIQTVLSQNQKAVEDYKKGKEQAFMYLVGQVMRQMKGKGDTHAISAIIRRIIVLG